MFKAPEKSITINERAFVFRRPGVAGLERIPLNVAQAFTAAGNMPGMLQAEFGQGLRMRAIVTEYIGACPDDWKVTPQPKGTKRPVIDFEEVDPAEFAEVGRAAVEFHESFRDVDNLFRAADRQD